MKSWFKRTWGITKIVILAAWVAAFAYSASTEAQRIIYKVLGDTHKRVPHSVTAIKPEAR